MQVKKYRSSVNIYKVSDVSRLWSVNMNNPETPYILNEYYRDIKPNGRLGKKIMKAVHEYLA